MNIYGKRVNNVFCGRGVDDGEGGRRILIDIGVGGER
jgi:hypothetical protein